MSMGESTNISTFAQQYIETLSNVLQGLPLDDLERAIQYLERTIIADRQVFLAGNGGSAATASHMANDLLKGVAKGGGRGFRAIALSDNVPLITAIANDESYSEVFSGQLAALGQPDDMLIVISASGNSKNIIRVIEVARELQMNTIAFLGMGGGQAAKMVDVAVVVPSDDYGPIEDIHMVFDHLITAYLRGLVAETRD